MHKIVHLDLKGAPLKIPFLEQVLKTAKTWGCTGVLLEWEDTFPYTGDLVNIGSIGGSSGDEMYSMEEVHHILWFIKNIGLEPIHLIQTIGHMEFVLKHPAFHDLREEPKTPAVLCPSKPQSLTLVKKMLQQALDVQPDAKYFHIGADEVWHTGVCEQCHNRAITNEHKVPSLYLQHIREIVTFLKQQRPELIVLMWDDMLRSINIHTLEHYKIGDLIEPVVWNYNVKEHFQIEYHLWDTYKKLFPNVWVGSAFKGANGSCQVLSPVTRYVSNQQAWLREIRSTSNKINFAGVILTGWSRYDHYATLCELLPVAMPSLSCCLLYWKSADEHIEDEFQVSEVLPEAEWAGRRLALCVHSFVMLRDRARQLLDGDPVATWLNPWQLKHGYTSPAQVEGIAGSSYAIWTDLKFLHEDMLKEFPKITGKRSSDEWMESYFTPLFKRISDLHEAASVRCNTPASVRPS
ncbi:unnamed protein product [Euphydryas editha]|uniref:Beta-N-acetylhexosaminidase n=1 Tax=Euphydryas editha TaxID=104508 RepID=A0AAU9V755_EUPED|nr:unnamed protein product [Euphydryas editha]